MGEGGGKVGGRKGEGRGKVVVVGVSVCGGKGGGRGLCSHI